MRLCLFSHRSVGVFSSEMLGSTVSNAFCNSVKNPQANCFITNDTFYIIS